MPTKTYKIQIAVSKTTSDGQAAKVQNDFKLATQYHAKGQLDLATELYKSTLKASPKHKVALFQLGAITSESDVKAAVALFDQAIAIDTNDPQPYFGKGYAFYKARNYEQALANYNKAIALRPDFELAYCNRGIIYLDLKRLRAALDDFAKAVILNPGNPKNYNNRGLALKEVKQNKLALADFDKAINLDPGYAEAYYNRGNTHRKLDRLREAEQDYAKALANDPDYQFLPGLHLHLKMFLCDWDNFDQAYQSLVEKN